MNDKARFSKLLEPYHIGKIQTRNRIVKTGAGTGYSDMTGFVTDRHMHFYESIARGGAGLVILRIGTLSIEPPSEASSINSPALRIDNDKYIPRLKQLANVIHKHGCPTFLQFLCLGAWHLIGQEDINPVSSSHLERSELPGPLFDPPREITTAEIKYLVDIFTRAAERAHEAGFDGVEINADTSHMLNSFLSRFWNRRQDDYGCQTLENRARVVVEIISSIKQRLGKDFPVVVLINGAEYGLENGINIQEAQGFSKLFQTAGADALHVRAYGYGDYVAIPWPEHVYYPAPPKVLPEGLDWSHYGAGAMVPLAAAVKNVVSIPVIAVGRLNPEIGDQLIREGKADFIGMTRRLLADPDLPNKIASGRIEDITPCTSCLECSNFRLRGLAVRCRINAALGSEFDYVLTPALKKKKVLVVGGGPAGMEAARVAATRGHEVILFEKEPKLGGLLPLAALVKGPEIEDLPAIVRYFKTQLIKLGVKIVTGHKFTPSLLEEIKPDVVILATGGTPPVPDIPGINGPNVVSGVKLHRMLKTFMRIFGPRILRWLTKLWMPLGKRVIIIGGQIQGCELAEFLVKRGRKVTIVDTLEKLGEGLVVEYQDHFLNWLENNGTKLMAGVKYVEISSRGLTVLSKEGQRVTIEADTIVTAVPLKPNNELLNVLKGKVSEVYAIGDAEKPGLIVDATADGWRIARTL